MQIRSLLLIIGCCLVPEFGLLPHVACATADKPVTFELDVQPILVAQGCSAGSCNGKSRGQNGFPL